MNKSAIVILIIIVLALLGWAVFRNTDAVPAEAPAVNTPNPDNTVPGVTPPVVYEPAGTAATQNEIAVVTPVAGSLVTSPLRVEGRARGPWYFEASAPVTATDLSGKILGQSFVTAQGEWMTTEFVPFTGELRFTNPDNVTEGYIVFTNDNPSGDPSRSKYLMVPVRFAK